MKNIYILPTDKPSKLYLGDNGNFVFGLIQSSIKSKNNDFTNQHIYITSEEEIKEGWKGYAYKEDVKGKVFKHSYTYNQWYKDAKQIVLTNDPTLIEDGVQQVSSSFLSFYAENQPDYVEIFETKVYNEALQDYAGSLYSYKFPRKEIKTEENVIDQWLEKSGNSEIMKQVEREAELYQTINKIIDGGKNLPKGFEVSRGQAIDYAFDVALEVAEKLYTEEDLHNTFYNGWIYRGENYTFPKAKKEWFEQFKK